MDKAKKEIFKSYISSGINSFLLEDIDNNVFKNSVVIESDCDISILNGHYEKEKFIGPSWYLDLVNNKKNLLIINNINNISIYEQGKFLEILQYRKISTFDLPNNCIIVATCSNLKENPINKDIYSLMVHI